MKQKRDLSQAQFEYRARKLGFSPAGFLGYWNIGNGVSVSIYNVGERRRDQLAYLKNQAKLETRRKTNQIISQ